MSVDWETVRSDFEPDGALRDIYARPADVATWDRALAFLASVATLRYLVDGVDGPVPQSAAGPLSRSDGTQLLIVDIEPVGFTCHFFAVDEIELSFGPEEVQDQASLDSLGRFVAGLSKATGCDVLVTPENMPDRPILQYIAHTDTWGRAPSPAG
jgi:hypothetical protein